MKKIVVSLCLLYAANSCAVSAGKILSNCLVAGIGGAIIGAFNFPQTSEKYAKKLAVAEENDYSLRGIKNRVEDDIPSFVLATTLSTVSPYVIPAAAGAAVVHDLNRDMDPEKKGATISDIIKKDGEAASIIAGLATGLVCHITIRNALKLLKKVK